MRTARTNCRPWRPTARNTACRALVIALLVGAAPAHAALYRWVDSNGRVHYGDTLPPTYQKSGAVELNKQGVTVRRTESEAERRATAAARAEAERKKREADEQARLDRALTSTYTSEAEIDLARDRALEHHQLAIQSAQLRLKQVAANIQDLAARIANIRNAGRPVGANLERQLAASEAEARELERIVQQNQEAMAKVREKYAADKARFRALQDQAR